MKYKTSLKNFTANLSLVFASLVFLFLIFEFVIFRFVLKASDFPKIESVNQVIKYKPNQTGISRVKNEIAARYSINANGWNSSHKRYTLQSPPYKKRIAIIGDSYIEAFFVNYTASVAEQLEERLGKDRFEVYRFGIGGAPMSQYLHILRREVLGLHPTLVIIVLSHNDFDESYRFVQGLYDSNFLKLEIRDGRVVGEIPPRKYSPRWYTPIRFSATWRYLHFRELINLQFLKNIILGKKEKKFQANIDATLIHPKLARIAIATDYIFNMLKAITIKHRVHLLIVIDGDRGRIYKQTDTLYDYDSGFLVLNKTARETAQKYGIDFIDLHLIFSKVFLQNRKEFNFKSDGHWNAWGHKIVADHIYQYLNKNRQLLN